jgi:FKBP-type peptidyl-prolyl cis-trans isomerase FkpA
MNNLVKTTLVPVVLAMGLSPAIAQTKSPEKKVALPAAAKSAKKTTASSDGFKKLPSSLEYKIVKKGPGTRKAVIGDHIEMFIHVRVADSVLFDSRKMYNATKPVPYVISTPKYSGDIMEGFMMLNEGDSAIFRTPVDSMKKMGPVPPFVKEGDKMEFQVVMVSIRSEEEDKKAQAQKSEAQKATDEALLQDYFKRNNIKAMKTPSGLYYTISREGSGAAGQAGNTYSVNYTGKLLNGNVFDSNTDTAYKHVEPFNVEVGKGRVIKGWDEGLLLLKKGTKATLYIPSGLAYGSQDQSPRIPANSILVFDVEILDITSPEELKAKMDQQSAGQRAKEDQALQEYFAKNNIKATKTESGLYYVITQKGLGEHAKPGNKVTMNYTGKTMDGNAFDSNIDPKFNHVQPFVFTLGQGQVIKGWDEGVQLLQLGSKGTLYIPSTLGYGERGAGGAIPPNATLIFDVEVVGIDKK